MIQFHIERAGGVPAYVQLVQQVREALRVGWLSPGDRLPTVREVVVSCVVNANTVSKAYRELEAAGLVESRRGSGTYVKATLGSADPQAVAKLRVRLVQWVESGRDSGLDDEDMRALLGDVLSRSRSEGVA